MQERAFVSFDFFEETASSEPREGARGTGRSHAEDARRRGILDSRSISLCELDRSQTYSRGTSMNQSRLSFLHFRDRE